MFVAFFDVLWLIIVTISVIYQFIIIIIFFQDLYCVRSDLGNLLKALGRLEEAKVLFASA